MDAKRLFTLFKELQCACLSAGTKNKNFYILMTDDLFSELRICCDIVKDKQSDANMYYLFGRRIQTVNCSLPDEMRYKWWIVIEEGEC